MTVEGGALAQSLPEAVGGSDTGLEVDAPAVGDNGMSSGKLQQLPRPHSPTKFLPPRCPLEPSHRAIEPSGELTGQSAEARCGRVG